MPGSRNSNCKGAEWEHVGCERETSRRQCGWKRENQREEESESEAESGRSQRRSQTLLLPSPSFLICKMGIKRHKRLSGIWHECQEGKGASYRAAEVLQPFLEPFVEAEGICQQGSVKIATSPLCMALFHSPTLEPSLHRKAGTEQATDSIWTCRRPPV